MTEEQERERQLFQAERARVPELFDRQAMIDDPEILRWIGIDYDDEEKPVAHVKLYPQDFIVEEISGDGAVHTIDVATSLRQRGEGSTYYADLVKVGLSTFEVQAYVCDRLGIDPKNFGYAGIKDKQAITAQQVSLKGLADPAPFLALSENNFFFKNVVQSKGVIARGELLGNQFTITLRFAAPLTEEAQEKMRTTLRQLGEDGFWNFYYIQRFGTPRLLSHLLGLLLVKGQYEEVVKTFITHPAMRELPYFQAFREDLQPLWGDWRKLEERLSLFPYHFTHELRMMRHLVKASGDFRGALHEVQEQVSLWFYAYDSYLFNRKLSALIREGEVPSRLPIATSFDKRDQEPYKEYLAADGVVDASRHYRDFSFMHITSRSLNTVQQITIHNAVVNDRYAILSFSLPKASYATTFLMHLFSLSSGLPFPSGIATEKIDPKRELGTGDISAVSERFQAFLAQKESDMGGPSEN